MSMTQAKGEALGAPFFRKVR